MPAGTLPGKEARPMRFRTACWIGLLTLLASIPLAWPGLFGQDRPPAPSSQQPISNPNDPAAIEAANRSRAENLARIVSEREMKQTADLSKMQPLAQQMYRSAQSGADWLCRANRPDGRFDYGYLPALKAKLEGDHYLRQAGAAFALARAARYFGDERHIAVARQAVLSLMLETIDGNGRGDRKPPCGIRRCLRSWSTGSPRPACWCWPSTNCPRRPTNCSPSPRSCAPTSAASSRRTARFGCTTRMRSRRCPPTKRKGPTTTPARRSTA